MSNTTNILTSRDFSSDTTFKKAICAILDKRTANERKPMLGYLTNPSTILALSRIEASNPCLAVSGTIAFKPPRSLDTKLEIGVPDRWPVASN